MTDAMTAAIVIPARYGSSRLPGKPMKAVRGIPMLERVWRIAKAVKGCSRIVVATDDPRIIEFAEGFGAEGVLTSEKCRNGTERVFEAAIKTNLIEPVIVNLQGDAVLTPPWVVEAMITQMLSDQSIGVLTPAIELSESKLAEFLKLKTTSPSSGTTVVFDQQYRALYFSKGVLPFVKNRRFKSTFRHVGLYAYRLSALKQYVDLQPSPLEMTEELEQLRLLENSLPLRVLPVDYKGRTHASIDNIDDIAFAEKIIESEGELF